MRALLCMTSLFKIWREKGAGFTTPGVMATGVSFAQYLSTSRGRETEEWRADSNTKVGRLIHKLKVTKVL